MLVCVMRVTVKLGEVLWRVWRCQGISCSR